MALRECAFLVGLRHVVEHVAAAAGVEIAAIVDIAPYANDIRRWRSVCDVAGETWVEGWLWRS